MAKQNGDTAEEAGLYPRGGNLDIPKRGSYGKWAAGTAAGILFLGGLTAGYKALKSDYKTPDNSQKHAIVETEGVPEGFGKKPEIAEDSVNIEDNKLYQDPLKRLARVDENGVIYPNGVDNDYDFSDIKQATLALIEYVNAGDKKNAMKMTVPGHDVYKDFGGFTHSKLRLKRIEVKPLSPSDKKLSEDHFGKVFDKTGRVSIIAEGRGHIGREEYKEKIEGTFGGNIFFLFSEKEKRWYAQTYI